MKRYIEILRKTISVIVVTFLFVQFFTVSPLISEENSSDTNTTENQTTETIDNNENNTNNTDPSSGDVNNENNDEVTPGNNTYPSNPTDAGDVTDPNDNTDPNENNDQSDVTDNTGNNPEVNPNDNTEANNKDVNEIEYDVFVKEIEDVIITVKAEKGVFPDNSYLYVEKVEQVKEIDEAIQEVRQEDKKVAVSYTYDIKIFDQDDNEVQPSEGAKVSVSFALKHVANENLETNVYHINENQPENVTADNVEPLEVVTEGKEAIVETESFSFYTVEFTYNDKQYVLEGDGYVRLSEILETVELTGEVVSWEISNNDLFSIVMGGEDEPSFIYVYEPDGTPGVQDEEDENYRKVLADYKVKNDPNGTTPWVVSYQPFTSEEWLDITMDDDVTYRIIVTDAIMGDNTINQNIPGLSQGENLTNFAPLIPVADVWIDSTRFYTPTDETKVNGDWNEFIPGELMDPNSSKYVSAFKQDYPVNEGTSIASNKAGRHFVYYDSTVTPLDDYISTTRISDSVTIYQSANIFEGTLCSYVWKEAAVRLKEDGTEEKLDVHIEYSNPIITIQPLLDTQMSNASQAQTNSANVTDPSQLVGLDNYYVGIVGGNVVTTGAKTPDGDGLIQRYALQIDVRPYVTDSQGNIIDAKIYFPIRDVDVRRDNNSKFAGFYKGNPLLSNYDNTTFSYGESVKIKDGLVLNSSGDRVYIPGSDGNYHAKISYDNGEYTITAHGGDNNSFYSGFLTLIQNGQFDMTVRASGGNAYGTLFAAAMLGGDYNYRLRHSTETLKADGTPEADGTKGGTIRTTREGNHNGELNDGQIIEPSMIATAVGQTIVYTFTPKPGYALNAVYVWKDGDKTTLDFPTIEKMKESNKLVEGDGSNNTFIAHDDDHDGVVDRYTYSFEAINEDNAIHVVWVKTALSIRKSVTGSGAVSDTFTFTIKSWGDSDKDGNTEFIDFANDPNMGNIASRFTSLGNGLYQFTLNSGETLNIPDGAIPFGFEYEVEEIQVDGKYGTKDGWSPVGSTLQNGKLTEDDPHGNVSFTNKRKKDVDPAKKLTVKKIWQNDVETIRPRNITMTIQNGVTAINLSNNAFRNAFYNLFGGQTNARNQLTGIKYGTKAAAESATNKYVFEGSALTFGDTPVTIYKEGTDLYIYSDAEIYFDGSMASMFYGCANLTDITGLSRIHTDFVTEFNGTFSGCLNLTNLTPLANWNTASATSMFQMFMGAGTTASNWSKLTDLTPLADWDTRNVTTMSQMFRYCNVSDLTPIAGWDVSRVTSMSYMFQYSNAALTDNTALRAWDPGLVTNWDYMFRYANGTTGNLTVQQMANLPVFTKRTGTWNNVGTYTNVQGKHNSTSASSKPVDTKIARLNAAGVTLTQSSHDVDPTDPTGNTWIYEFEVPKNTSWKVWETLPDGYAPYYVINSVTYEAPDGTVADLGTSVGTETSPVKGAVAQSTTTITNKRNEHELKIKKGSASATNEKFTFTLKLWSVTESNTYDLPSNHPKLQNGSIKRLGPGIYEFTLIPPGSEELMLPAGIRYRVVETPAKGWSLISEHDSYGLLNRDKEASFINAQYETLKIIKTWENDYDNNVVMSNRPTGQNSLGIKVVTQDNSTRWKQTGPSILTDIVGTQPQQDAYYFIKNLYDASTLIPELKSYDGETDIPTTAPRRVYVENPVGVITSGGDYVVDAVAGNTGQLTVYPVEIVPYEHEYTQANHFTEDDGANQWIYEFDIPYGDNILSVEETNVPEYYQKFETTTDVEGRIVYNVVNSLDVRNLEIKKETVDDEPGIFQYGIKFYFDTDTSEPHPVKVGHSQFIEDESADPPLVEYELFFENGVTLNGKDISGLSNRINDDITGDKLTKAEGDAIVEVLRNLATNADTMVNGVHPDFTRHHSTALTLADLGIKWNGQDTETIYVEQDSSVVKNMFTTGRRLDWFIIPTPGQDEVISIRTPYTLRRETQIKNGITYPKQIPNNVTGADGTYYFTLRNGEKIVFNDLPVGVSYEIVEMKQIGWDLVSKTNDKGKMSDGISETWIYNGQEYSTRAAAEAAALTGVTPSTVSGNTIYTTVATFANKDAAVASVISKKNDNTWAYNNTNYSSYNDANEAAVLDARNSNNNDYTYGYGQDVFYSKEYVEGIAIKDIEEVVLDENGTQYRINGNLYSTYELAVQAARDAVTTSGVGIYHAYEYNGTSYRSDIAADYEAQSDIDTVEVNPGEYVYEYNGVTYNTYEDAYDVAKSNIIRQDVNTYTYDGVTYSTLAEVEAIALAKIKANEDNTYTVNNQSYPNYNAAKTAAEALVVTNTTATGATYTATSQYSNIYDAQKAAKLAITKKPYTPILSTFKNEREKADIEVIKKTVGNAEGEFTFRMMTGRVVKPENVVDKNGNKLTIERVYPDDKEFSELLIDRVETHNTYTEYFVSNTDVYKLTDEIIGGQEVRKVYHNGNEINVFNVVYPLEFTDSTGMNYKFIPETKTVDDTTTTTWKLQIETTTFEFKLKNNESATIKKIPYASAYRIYEVSDKEGELIGKYWELISIDGDSTKISPYGENNYPGFVAVLKNNEKVSHTFLNKGSVNLTLSKIVTGNMGNKTDEFKFKVKIGDFDLSEYGGVLNNNYYEFTLKHNDEIKFKNIPYGTEFEIIEDDYSGIGYITKVNGNETHSVSGELTKDVTYEFENQNGAVVPTKAFAGYFMPIIIMNFMALCYILYDRRRKRLDNLDE